MKITCVFCGNSDPENWTVDKKVYHFCRVCGGIFLDKAFLLDPYNEKKRYELHENNPKNTGYLEYLENFIRQVTTYPAIGAGFLSNCSTVFDYGSGPEPVLANLLKQKGFSVRFWDPYFAPDNKSFEGGANLVTCLEVAEHFAEPVKDFNKLAACLADGGFAVIGTRLFDRLPEEPDEKFFNRFESWWYRRDATHISLYSRLALQTVASSAGLEWIGEAAPNIYVFKRR